MSKTPSPVQPNGATGWRRRLVRHAPVLLLLLSLGVAGFAAVQGYQAQRSHRATADTLLKDYGAFAAWSYANQWVGRLNESMAGTLNGVRIALARGVGVQDCLELLFTANDRVLPECACGIPLTGPQSWAFHASLSGGPPITAGSVPPASELDRILAAVADHARDAYRGGQSHTVLEVPDDASGGSRVIAYARGSDPVGDTVVYGLQLDPGQLQRLFERILDDAELLPPSLARGAPNRSLVAVELASSEGGLRFVSAPAAGLSHPAEQHLPPQVGGGTIRASVHPEVADQLIIGGLPGSRIFLLLAIFGLAAGLALIAVIQLRKENEIAGMRSDFVASVSHELRSPLAQVRLFVETLRLGRTRTREQSEWALANIDRETLRLAGLVENVLAFSRAERGRLAHVEVQPADLGEEISAATSAFSRLVPVGRMHLDLRVQPGLGALLHRDSFRQVVLNLLDNAVRYGPKGQTVLVEAGVSGDRFRIAVQDQGPGVRPEEREVIFEPFRRGRRAIREAAAGSGIGLAVVRDLVRAHGGRVWVEEGEAGGARFVVELPTLSAPRAGPMSAGAGSPEPRTVGVA